MWGRFVWTIFTCQTGKSTNGVYRFLNNQVLCINWRLGPTTFEQLGTVFVTWVVAENIQASLQKPFLIPKVHRMMTGAVGEALHVTPVVIAPCCSTSGTNFSFPSTVPLHYSIHAKRTPSLPTAGFPLHIVAAVPATWSKFYLHISISLRSCINNVLWLPDSSELHPSSPGKKVRGKFKCYKLFTLWFIQGDCQPTLLPYHNEST